MKIFIAGGTTGIGLAVAIKYLDLGHEVAVCGRDLSKLQISNSYPLLSCYELDICHKTDLEKAVKDFANEHLDLMLISAGYYSNDAIEPISYAESTDMLHINIAGTVNALEVARQAMMKHGGHIAILASVSGLIVYPNMTTYSMTKRAVIQIANAYRRALRDFGVSVTVIAPGYVNSQKLQEINDGDTSDKLFLVDCDYAASCIIDAIRKKQKQLVFPPKMKYTIALFNLLPGRLISYIMYKRAKWAKNK